MNKHNQKPIDMFKKQDVTVYYLLKYENQLDFQLHIPDAVFVDFNILIYV